MALFASGGYRTRSPVKIAMQFSCRPRLLRSGSLIKFISTYIRASVRLSSSMYPRNKNRHKQVVPIFILVGDTGLEPVTFSV